MEVIDIEKFLWAAISILTFLVVCGGLIESRLNKKGTIFVAAGFLIGIIGLQAILFLSTRDSMLVLTMLPLTSYLPAIIGIHILSRAKIFQTTAVWAMGLFVSFILAFSKVC